MIMRKIIRLTFRSSNALCKCFVLEGQILVGIKKSKGKTKQKKNKEIFCFKMIDDIIHLLCPVTLQLAATTTLGPGGAQHRT